MLLRTTFIKNVNSPVREYTRSTARPILLFDQLKTFIPSTQVRCIRKSNMSDTLMLRVHFLLSFIPDGRGR